MADQTTDPRIETIFDADAIENRLSELAQEIAAKKPKNLLVVAILKGSFVFAADLIRALNRAGLEPEVDFLTLSSYRKSTSSSGQVTILRDLDLDVAGRHVILVDDVLDSGRTLAFAKDLLSARGAARIETCVLLDKPSRRVETVKPDYVGFEIPDVFVVGYGLDYAEKYRNLPFVGVLKPEMYRS